MTVKTELRKYYAKQGLTGQHARQAIRYDLWSIRKQRRPHNDNSSLMDALGWNTSREGGDYWVNRFLCTGK
jgi:hypothetical protein